MAEYHKSECGRLHIMTNGNAQTKVAFYPNSKTFSIETTEWSIEHPFEQFKNIAITAREFQEAYLRAKTALDEIVSAE